jgi:hypothetical protein
MGHVNEQPLEYWVAVFAIEGFGFSPGISERLRVRLAAARHAPWLSENCAVFAASDYQSSIQ